jgi:hypothetical protein
MKTESWARRFVSKNKANALGAAAFSSRAATQKTSPKNLQMNGRFQREAGKEFAPSCLGVRRR